jgi:YjjG family noncanonical pyrimidine nucleotidase
MGTLRCVTLDLDDTLWDHRRAQAEALRLIASENVSAELVDTFVGRFHYHNKILWAQYGVGEVDVATVKQQRFERALQDVGASSHDAEAMGEEFLRRYGRLPYLCPGAREVLTALDGRVLIGCITDGFTEVQHWKLETTKIDRHFNFVLTSEEVGVTKPDPAIYAAATAAARCPADEIVHVGDSFEKDVVGAMAYGMRAAWLPHPELALPSETDPAPHWVLANLHELPAALGLDSELK